MNRDDAYENRPSKSKGDALGRGLESLMGDQESWQAHQAADARPNRTACEEGSQTRRSEPRENGTPASTASESVRRVIGEDAEAHPAQAGADVLDDRAYRTPRVGDELFFVINPAEGSPVQSSDRRTSVVINPSPKSVLSAAGAMASAAIAGTIVIAACAVAGAGAVASIALKKAR